MKKTERNEPLMTDYMQWYKDKLISILNEICETQETAIDQAAQMVADTVLAGKNVYAFGPSHAGMMVEEMVYRGGGLAVINPIHVPNLMPNVRPYAMTTQIERLPGLATITLERSGIKPGDCLIIHSVSARIPIVIEMAMKAKEKGIHVIGIVSKNFASKVTSLDPSGTMMMEHCEIVIDDCAELGDACVPIEGLGYKAAPTSTVGGAYVVNSLVIKVAEKMLAAGVQPPIFKSGNVDGANEYNAQLMEKYKAQIHYLN